MVKLVFYLKPSGSKIYALKRVPLLPKNVSPERGAANKYRRGHTLEILKTKGRLSLTIAPIQLNRAQFLIALR